MSQSRKVKLCFAPIVVFCKERGSEVLNCPCNFTEKCKYQAELPPSGRTDRKVRKARCSG